MAFKRCHAPRISSVGRTISLNNPEFFALDLKIADNGMIACNDLNHAFAAAAAANRKAREYSRWVPCHQTKDGFQMLDFIPRNER